MERKNVLGILNKLTEVSGLTVILKAITRLRPPGKVQFVFVQEYELDSGVTAKSPNGLMYVLVFRRAQYYMLGNRLPVSQKEKRNTTELYESFLALLSKLDPRFNQNWTTLSR